MAQCKLLFFLPISVFRTKGISNGIQTVRKLREDLSWNKHNPGELEGKSEMQQGGHAAGRRAPHPRGQGVGPLVFILCQYFLYIPKIFSVDFQFIPRTLFLQKNNIMANLLKTASVRVVPFKSYKLESKTRAKVFGKVDTMETYQLPQS